jgi:hypothetical protein
MRTPTQRFGGGTQGPHAKLRVEVITRVPLQSAACSRRPHPALYATLYWAHPQRLRAPALPVFACVSPPMSSWRGKRKLEALVDVHPGSLALFTLVEAPTSNTLEVALQIVGTKA